MNPLSRRERGQQAIAMNDTHDIRYMTGFGNEFASEALAGTLPITVRVYQRGWLVVIDVA